MLRIYSCLVLLLVHSIGYALDPSRELTERLQNISTIQSKFVQTVKDKLGRTLSQSEGVLLIKRPDQFYWEIVKPYQQKIITDGKTLWNYDIDLEQVTINQYKDYAPNSPFYFLLNQTLNVMNLFHIHLTQQNNELIFELIPREKETEYTKINAHFDGKQLKKIVIYDHLNQQTSILFTQVILNKSISSYHFKFNPPKNVDIIQETLNSYSNRTPT